MDESDGTPVKGRVVFASSQFDRNWPWCRIGWHVWTFYEDVGVAPYHGTGQFQLVQERTCRACGRKHRRHAGWSTMVETNAHHAESQVVVRDKLKPRGGRT